MVGTMCFAGIGGFPVSGVSSCNQNRIQKDVMSFWVQHVQPIAAICSSFAEVDGLYDECLIDSKMRNSLLSAAKTGGSVKLSGKNMQILDRAKARLGYLFTSLRSILGDGNIKFKPYVPAATDGVCDALGITHRGRIPSLTQIVPVYSEEGIMDIKELVGDPKAGAVSTMLEFLISQLPREWDAWNCSGEPQNHPCICLQGAGHDRTLLFQKRIQGDLRRE